MTENQIIYAPAKINLTLSILNKRDDGYHNVEMIMQTVNLYDKIIVSKNDEKKINIICTHPFVPTDERNLVYKAVTAFFDELEIPFCGVDINIKKIIPVQAGLAGGSTDCAGTLIALKNMFAPQISKSKLAEIGGKIGSDVPFCIHGGTMLATGRGTVLEKLPAIPNCRILLIKPQIGVSTAKAYALADEREGFSLSRSPYMIDAIKNNNLKEVSSLLYNDFEKLLNIEEINHIKNELLNCGALNACMSGSGPTVYGIFSSKNKAKDAYDYFKRSFRDVFLCKPCRIK